MPTYDGLVERFNQPLAQMLTYYVETRQRDWDVQMPLVMMAPYDDWTCPWWQFSHVEYVQKIESVFNEVFQLAMDYN